VAITGTERVGFTLVITEGFGTIPMAAKTFKLLQAHAGQKASISGATQIRAGVIRPEIIIARTGPAGVSPAVTREGEEPGPTGLKIGDHVRIIRDPLFGRLGQVVALHPELTKIETESEVRVLEVQFADKAMATIPRANVEIIEG
jgi:transcription antitermination factor NusG